MSQSKTVKFSCEESLHSNAIIEETPQEEAIQDEDLQEELVPLNAYGKVDFKVFNEETKETEK